MLKNTASAADTGVNEDVFCRQLQLICIHTFVDEKFTATNTCVDKFNFSRQLQLTLFTVLDVY